MILKYIKFILMAFSAISLVSAVQGEQERPASGESAGGVEIDLPSSVQVKPLEGEEYSVTFTHKAPGAKQVYLAGPFNQWNAAGSAMIETAPDTFSLAVTLQEGVIPYKFVVDGQWISDPANPEGADDGQGGRNSVLRLGGAAQVRVSREAVGDGRIFSSGLKHDPGDIAFLNPKHDGSVVVKLRAMADDVESAWVRSAGISATGATTHPMVSEYANDRIEMFRAELPMETLAANEDADGTSGATVLRYEITAQDSHAANEGRTDSKATSAEQVNRLTFKRRIDSEDIFSTPEWARHVVWYQIFPERFRNGSKANDPKASGTALREWTGDWFRRGPNETGRAMEPGVFGRRYGGDFQGVIEKLPYLKDLGVGAIYFNPVFEAESLHKYDATDFRHIDDNFGFAGDYETITAQEDLLDPSTWKFSGSDKLFLEFLEKAHAAGIRVVLDGVFNHTGTDHPAFQDILKHGADSRFADWYNVTSWEPFEYEGWFGVAGLPVFEEDDAGFVSDSLTTHIFAVTRRWMDPNGDGDPSDGVDGWRLDVANEVSSEFWREWRDHVKSINPDALIIGEIWDPPAKWLEGDQFDAVMNYQMAKAMTDFFINGGKAADLRQAFSRLQSWVPDQANAVMMNLMDSHDTDRLVSMLSNPGRGYDSRNRQQDVEPGEYSSAKPSPEVYQRLKQLVAVQFAYPGGPMIYYGDEAGMWGADDPEDRKPMIWRDLQPYAKPEKNRFMEDVYKHYRRLAAIRNSLPALQTGDYEALVADDNARVFTFRRFTNDQDVIVATNDSDKTQTVKIPTTGTWHGLPARDRRTNDTQSAGAYVDVLNDKAVKVTPGEMSKDSETMIHVGSDAKRMTTENGILKLEMEPRSTAILTRVR